MTAVTVDTRGTASTTETPNLIGEVFAMEPPEFPLMPSLSSLGYRVDAFGGTIVEGSPTPPLQDGEAARAKQIDEFMAWVTDPKGMDWALIERHEDWDDPEDS